MPFKPKWSEEKKYEVVLHYFVKGNNNSKAAARATGVPADTIRGWTKTQWWAEMMREVRARHADRLDGKFTYLLDKLSAELVDRIDNGEEVLHQKTGEMLRKKMSARDVTFALDRIIERRALLRGDPTSRASTVSSEKQLENLQKKLEEAGAKRRKEIAKQVEESDNVEELKVNEN